MRPRSFDVQAPTGSRRDLKALAALAPELWPANAPELRLRVVWSLIFLGLAKAATVGVPVILKFAVDALVGPGAGTKTAPAVAVPVALLIAYGAARITALVFRELQGAVFTKVAERAIRNAGLRTFRHLHGLALRFHLDRQTGGLSRAIDRGTKGIEYLLRMVLFSIVPTVIEIIMVLALLFGFFDAGFALVTAATIAAYAVWTLIVTEWRIAIRRDMNQSDQDANTKAIDSLLNYETVKYFGNEEHEAERFDSALRAYEAAAVKNKTTLSMLNAGQGIIIAIGVTVIMIMAGYGVQDGTMTIGDFVLVNTYLLQLYLPLNFLGSSYREIKHSLTDMEQMFSLLDERPEVKDKDNAFELTITGGAVAFEDVSFNYDPRRPVLEGISFSVPAGRSIAIVGPSGAGKSTISRLLFRFYDPTAGRITIDGRDIRDVTQSSLRAAIGMVPQDTVLFNDTIRYNIGYGRPGAPQAEIDNAARLARIHDFILSLPDGYDSLVGERGLKLSGGEKQRVAIARTLLKGPRIFLFDEATSSLDTNTEKDIQANLKEVSAGRTTIMIAHRLSTVIDADEIVVIDAGRIVEHGAHAALLAKGGVYAALWNRQQETEQAWEIAEPEPEENPKTEGWEKTCDER